VRKTPINDPIASVEFLWVRGDGASSSVHAVVGRPYRVDEVEWSCPVALNGVDGQYADVSGGDSMQALSLALALLHKRLADILDSGAKLVPPEGGEVWDRAALDATFGRSRVAPTRESG
jgi:hypothetical protein